MKQKSKTLVIPTWETVPLCHLKQWDCFIWNTLSVSCVTGDCSPKRGGNRVSKSWTPSSSCLPSYYSTYIVHHQKKVDNGHAKWSCAPPNWYKATLCTTKAYAGTELHCEPWFARSLSTTKILYLYTFVLVHHLCMFVVILPGKSALERTKSVRFLHVSCAPSKKWKMSEATPTSHGPRSRGNWLARQGLWGIGVSAFKGYRGHPD